MKVRDVMTRSIVTVSPDASIKEVAELMQKHNVGAIPVVDQNGLKGIVTDRDLVVRNIASGKDPFSTPVKEVMTSQVTAVTPDEDISSVTKIMASRQIRRLPVVDNQQVIGMISLGDIATTGRPELTMEASEALSEISKPSRPLKTNAPR